MVDMDLFSYFYDPDRMGENYCNTVLKQGVLRVQQGSSFQFQHCSVILQLLRRQKVYDKIKDGFHPFGFFPGPLDVLC